MSLKPVIIAGGQGSRFWPASRKSLPKQFLEFGTEGKSLIQATAERLEDLVSREDLLIITGQGYVDLCEEHVPEVKVVAEPCARNTAPAIALAAAHLYKKDPTSVMLIVWADAAIANAQAYSRVVRHAYDYMKDSPLLGGICVKPDSPHTGYGYLQLGSEVQEGVCQLKRFVEKPDQKTAEEFLQDGSYYWNPGMFIWRVDALMAAFEKYAPELYAGTQKMVDAIDTSNEAAVVAEVFNDLESISIDCAVMEKVTESLAFPVDDLGWSDVGAWDAWADLHEQDVDGNVKVGDVHCLDSKNNLVKVDDQLVALLGVDDMVIVQDGDALLICKKEGSQNVRQIVEHLKKIKKEEYV